MKKAGPMQVHEVLQKYLADTTVGERIEEASVVPEWRDRVGDAIAAVTVPLRVSRGELVVGVRSSAWLAELRLMQVEIVRRLNIGRERGKIRKIRFQMLDG